jgi:predicted RND superfamily exporter protein
MPEIEPKSEGEHHFMNHLIDFILKKYLYIIIFFALISIPAGLLCIQQRFFNNLEIFFDHNDPDLREYERLLKTFGSEEVIAIVLSAEDIFTAENLDIIKKISTMAKSYSAIKNIFSLSEFQDYRTNEEEIIFQKLVPDGILNQEALERIKATVMGNDIISGRLVSKDGKSTLIVMELRPFQDNQEKYTLIRSIKEAAQKIAGPHRDLIFTGPAYVEVEISRLSQRDFLIFTPLVFVVVFGLVALLLRNGVLSVVCQIDLFVAMVLCLGLFTLCRESFNLVTIAISPILMVVAVADSMHILSHFRDRYQPEKDDFIATVVAVIKRLWFPCLCTSLTTAVGFFAFLSSTVRPVKILGLYTGLGTLIAYLLNITFLPAALIFSRKVVDIMAKIYGGPVPFTAYTVQSKDTLLLFIYQIGFLVSKHYRKIMAIFSVLLVFTLLGLSRLKFETNFINYLPEKNAIKKDILSLQDKFGGTVPFLALVTAKSPDKDFSHYESLQLLADIQEDLQRMVKKFVASFSIADYIKEVNFAFNDRKPEFRRLPPNSADINDYYMLSDSNITGKLVSPDKKEALITFQSQWGTNEQAKKEFGPIMAYIEKKLGNDYTFQFTGITTLYLKMEHRLRQSQNRSFFGAFLVVFLIMFWVCGNWKLTIIAMIPNLLPILVTLGLMGWLSLPLDVSTIMIASITMGIAVDDTIHIITELRRHFTTYKKIPYALLRTMKTVGKPVIINSLVLTSGFSLLMLGSILPTKTFGALAAFAMLFAVTCDLFLLPSLILIFQPPIPPLRGEGVRNPGSRRLGATKGEKT